MRPTGRGDADQSGAERASLPTPGAPEREAVRGMFDRIARRYDRLNALLSVGMDRHWRRVAIDALRLPTGAQLLDVGTGTGDMLVEWLRRDPGNRGVGIDLSPAMLAVGREKLGRKGMGKRARLLRGDAESLPIRSGSCDGLTIAFGLRNVSRRGQALREFARALKPGGPLAVLELSWPRGVCGRLYRIYFAHVLPRLGACLSEDSRAYGYLPASVREFPNASALGAELRAAGFTDVDARPLSGGIVSLHRARR